MNAKRRSSSLHVQQRHEHVRLRHSHKHVLPSPSPLLLHLHLLLVVAAGVSMSAAHALSTFSTTGTKSTTTRSRPPVVRPLSVMSMTATIAAGTTSSTEPTDDCMTSSPDLNFLKPTPADTTLQNWCTQTAGIALSPSIQICTTPRSVAGRGLFATEDVSEGDVLALIPREVVFGVESCRDQLDTGIVSTAKNKSGRKRRWIKHMLSKLTSFQRRRGYSGTNSSPSTSEITDESTMWAPILTKYALEAKSSKHPWSEWIDQWARCDPMHDAYLKMGPILKIANNNNNSNQDDDLLEYQMMMEELICDTATKIQDMTPHLNASFLQAAVSIRLSRLEQHVRALGFADDDDIDLDEALRLYSLITSRAIELDSDTTAVLPFYDLANHSLQPNLGLEYVENDGAAVADGAIDSQGFYSIFARSDITAGSELFFRYTKFDEAMDENAALWAAINWGIPHVPSQYETEE